MVPEATLGIADETNEEQAVMIRCGSKVRILQLDAFEAIAFYSLYDLDKFLIPILLPPIVGMTGCHEQ